MGEAKIFLKYPNKDLLFSKETFIDTSDYKNDSNEKNNLLNFYSIYAPMLGIIHKSSGSY